MSVLIYSLIGVLLIMSIRLVATSASSEVKSNIGTDNDSNDHGEFIVMSTESIEVKEAADIAISELKQLSDTSIYTSLSLVDIKAAYKQDGIYHDNMILEVELASDYFKSKKSTENFRMIVMTRKDDGVKSFAIDEFPAMDEKSIEEFYIKSVEERRIKRKESFLKLQKMADVEESEKTSTESEVRAKVVEERLEKLQDNIDDLLNLVNSL